MKNINNQIIEAMYMEADVSYSKLISVNGKSNLYSKPMKYFSEILSENGWFKIHKSYMVNPQFIVQINEDRDSIQLQNGIVLPISRRKRTSVLKWRSNSFI
jgi:two-component system, LytTR family, response regulator